MERINDFNCPAKNHIYVHPDKSRMENSNIFFQGDNNILFIEDGVVLNNARIHFSGSNSLIYLRKSRHKIKVNLQIGQDSLLFVGKDNYFNDTLHISATEWQSVIVGNNCLFSFGIWLRTADPHLVYSTETNQRINHSKPILIGDHVWIGQDSLILKGTQIGSGSIVGGHSVVAGKKLPSNTIYGGNPAKQIRGGAFWLDNCTHTWTEERSKEWNCPPPPGHRFGGKGQVDVLGDGGHAGHAGAVLCCPAAGGGRRPAGVGAGDPGRSRGEGQILRCARGPRQKGTLLEQEG